jgi:hypothetical protein
VVGLEFKAAEYEADGRPSLYCESGARDWMRVETQPESMSVLWSTRRPVFRLLHSVSRMRPAEAEVLLITSTGRHLALGRRRVTSLARQMIHLETELGWGFLRLDFPDRVLTWESHRPKPSKALLYRHSRDVARYKGHRRRLAHPGELGLLATGLDTSYLSQLMKGTGTNGIAGSADALLARAAPLADRRVNLGRTERADAW